MKFPISEDIRNVVTRTSERARCGWAAPQPRFVLAIGALLLFLTLSASAQLFVNFSTVADTSTAIPEGTGTFVAHPTDPCVWFRNVAFGGTGSGGQQGLYVCAPTDPCRTIVNQNTPIPGGVGMFTAPVDPCVWERNVAFIENGEEQQGIYASYDGTLQKVADFNTPVPDGSGNFIGFPVGPSISGEKVAFIGSGSDDQQGVYIFVPPNPTVPPNPIVPVANTGMEIPNGFGNFTGFVPPNPVQPIPPVVSGNNVAFFGAGGDNQQGLYIFVPPNPITPVADMNTAIPDSGGVGNFFFFERLAIENADVAFVGGGPVTIGTGDDQFLFIQKGVYKVIGGAMSRAADRGTLVPGGTGWFSDFGAVAIDPGKVVFVGYGTDDEKGLYTDFAGPLAKVIAVGDTLGGKTVTDVGFGPFGFSNGEAVFRAAFDDGSQAVMLATFCTGLQFAGFHAPIGGADATGGSLSDPIRTFKLKSTIPIKMTLTDCDGAPVTGGIHTIQIIKWTNAVDSDPPIDASPTDAATSGNQFRVTDAATGAWQFNLDTKATSMTSGTWEIVVTLADGSKHTAFISVK